jgi:hypothetical protein
VKTYLLFHTTSIGYRTRAIASTKKFADSELWSRCWNLRRGLYGPVAHYILLPDSV